MALKLETCIRSVPDKGARGIKRKVKEVRLHMSEQKKTVSIPTNLYDAIQERVEGTEFNSVEEYVTFVLEEVIKDDDEEETAFTAEDEEEVKKRLRALGYLD